MKSNNTQYENNYKNTYSSKKKLKRRTISDNDAYHNGYETTVHAFCFSLSCLVDNLSLSESFRLLATEQTTVPLSRSSSFESLLLQ